MPSDLADFFVAIGQYMSLRATSAYMTKATTLQEDSNTFIAEFGEDFTALERQAVLSALSETDHARQIAQQWKPRRRDACRYARRAKTAHAMIRTFSEHVQAGRLYRSWPGQSADGRVDSFESDGSATEESLPVTGEEGVVPSQHPTMTSPDCYQAQHFSSPASPYSPKHSSHKSRRRTSSSHSTIPNPQNALVVFSPQTTQVSLRPTRPQKTAFDDYVTETRGRYLPHPPAGFYLGNIPHTSSPVWNPTMESHIPLSLADPNAPMHWVRSDGVSTVFYA
ncbi:hypothetical protein OF83DRAFT_1175428 [Amylostereum chailletii]|nr:hypothetical protein OF83DRAFT_1175428 [Amylostereum chailletii]